MSDQHTHEPGIAALRLPTDMPTPAAHVASVMARVRGAALPRVELARPWATRRWRTVATHATALAAGALVTIALVPRFAARDAAAPASDTSHGAGHTSSAQSSESVARACAERVAAARASAARVAAATFAAHQTSLLSALVEHATAGTLAATEAARAHAAAFDLASTQLAVAAESAEQQVALELDARRRAAEQLAAANERASVKHTATVAVAAAALMDSCERLGETFARQSAALAARHDASERAVAAPARGSEARHASSPPAHDWRAIDVDSASLAATGRRAEHVSIQRDGDRVALSTSGSLDETVEALLARLDDPDAAVRAAVELRLEDIAAEVGVPRAESARPRKGSDEPWWRSDRGQVAALTIGGASDTREPWRSWWSRARSVVGD